MPAGRSQMRRSPLITQGTGRNRNNFNIAPGVSANRLERKATRLAQKKKISQNPNRRPVIRTGPVKFNARREFRILNPLSGSTIRIKTPFTKRVKISSAARIKGVRGLPAYRDRGRVVAGASQIRRGRNQLVRGYPIGGIYNLARGRQQIKAAGYRTSVARRNTYVLRKKEHRVRRDSKGKFAGSY